MPPRRTISTICNASARHTPTAWLLRANGFCRPVKWLLSWLILLINYATNKAWWLHGLIVINGLGNMEISPKTLKARHLLCLKLRQEKNRKQHRKDETEEERYKELKRRRNMLHRRSLLRPIVHCEKQSVKKNKNK